MTDNPTAHIDSNTPLIPAINAWEIYLQDQGKSIHTIKAFLADMRMLSNYLPPDKSLGSITTNEINTFLDWMLNARGVPCSPKTLSRRITSIKSFFRWLTNAGVLLINPAEKVVQKSVISPLPVVLNDQEYEEIMETAENFRRKVKPDTRHYALVELLLTTGIKKGECINLSPNHVQLDAPEGPFLFIRYSNPQFRYKERKIPLPDSWLESFRLYQNQYPLKDRVFPWSQRRLEYLLEDLSTEAGIEKHLSFDMCRWTCALRDYESGMEPNKIRQKLGISKVQWREIKMKLRKLANQTETAP